MVKPNPILRVVTSSSFKIPIYFSDDQSKSYLSQIKARFKKLYDYLETCDEESYRPNIKKDFLIRISNLQNEIIGVIEQYLKGHPSNAYDKFTEMLVNYKVKEEISSLQQHKVPKNTNLFRIQPEYDYANLKSTYKNKTGFLNTKTKQDLFHPPFQRRRGVASNRFSISGYPSLYLSESLLTSYSECFPEYKAGNQFNAICLKNVRPLYVIDLSDDKITEDDESFPNILPKNGSKAENVARVINHLGMYHIVMASHTKIEYQPVYAGEKYYFKAEYIIPQLLLQWLKMEGLAIDGIRYKSCTGRKCFPQEISHYNYVLPVQSNLEKGFCPALSNAFLFTPVYSHYKELKKDKIIETLLQISNELTIRNFTPLK